jgi:hypothetical protein
MCTTDKPQIKLHEQRFMVSPCGFNADIFPVDAVPAKARNWTDETHLSDGAARRLMERRMLSTQKGA